MLWSASIDCPAYSLMAYRLRPVLSRLRYLLVPASRYPLSWLRTTRSTLLSRPYRFPVLSRAVRPTFPPRPCHFPALSRAVRPTLPFVGSVSRCVVRYSFGVSSRASRLPFCPVSRFLRSPFFPSFAGYYCTRRTFLLTLGFGSTHLCCVVLRVCVLCNSTKFNFWFLL